MSDVTPDPSVVWSAKELANFATGRHPGTIGLLRYFAFAHLPVHLRPYPSECCRTARYMVEWLPDGSELTAGLRKLLEAKDCFVRAAVDASDE